MIAAIAADAGAHVGQPGGRGHGQARRATPRVPGATPRKASARPIRCRLSRIFVSARRTSSRCSPTARILWVGTSGGAVRYDTASDEYKFYDTRSGLLSNGIFRVGKLQGRIALGTYGGGLALLDDRSGKWETYNVPEGLGDAFVYDFLQSANGDVWIATWSGANRVRGGALKERSRWELFTVANTGGGLPNDWVYGLAEGRDGRRLARHRGRACTLSAPVAGKTGIMPEDWARRTTR